MTSFLSQRQPNVFSCSFLSKLSSKQWKKIMDSEMRGYLDMISQDHQREIYCMTRYTLFCNSIETHNFYKWQFRNLDCISNFMRKTYRTSYKQFTLLLAIKKMLTTHLTLVCRKGVRTLQNMHITNRKYSGCICYTLVNKSLFK